MLAATCSTPTVPMGAGLGIVVEACTKPKFGQEEDEDYPVSISASEVDKEQS